jgi:hypothetical protein
MTRIPHFLWWLALLAACTGSNPTTQTQQASTVATPNPIPATLFGLHDDWATLPPEIPYGTARLWDNDVRWDNLANCVPDGVSCTAQSNDWNWKVLDESLSAIKSQCPNCDVIYTFGGIASYANHCTNQGGDDHGTCGHPSDGKCGNTRPYGCYLPDDLKVDGSGPNAAITTFFTFLATHIAQLDKTKYANVLYWDIGNEFDRDPCLDGSQHDPAYCPNGGNANASYTFIATYSQLQRIFADMKATVGALIPGSKFFEGDTAAAVQPRILANMMYCSDKPSFSCGCPSNGVAGYACRGPNVGIHASVDGVDWHQYFRSGTGQGEEILSSFDQARGALVGDDKNLPLWVTETSFGEIDELPDYDMQAGFAARLMVSCWSGGGDRCYWYRYNSHGCHSRDGRSSTGTMYDFTDLQCTMSPGLWWDGKAYGQVYRWLVGQMLVNKCTADSNDIWTCDLATAAGAPEKIVWWTEHGANEKSWCHASTPVIHGSCDGTPYTVPQGFHRYYTLDPAQCVGGCPISAGETVQITGQPILLAE